MPKRVTYFLMLLLGCSVGNSVVRNYWVVSIFPLLWIEFCVLLLLCSRYKVSGGVEELDA